jgi:hypothetical protein
MAVIVRHSGHRFGELIPAVPYGVRERSGPVFPIFLLARAVYLAAQRSHAIMIAGVKHPYAPCGVPYSAEAAGFGWEIRVVRAADRDAAVLLFDDRQRHSTYESN